MCLRYVVTDTSMICDFGFQFGMVTILLTFILSGIALIFGIAWLTEVRRRRRVFKTLRNKGLTAERVHTIMLAWQRGWYSHVAGELQAAGVDKEVTRRLIGYKYYERSR